MDAPSFFPAFPAENKNRPGDNALSKSVPVLGLFQDMAGRLSEEKRDVYMSHVTALACSKYYL